MVRSRREVTDFRRGALSDSNSDGVPATGSTASRSQGRSLDARGNWSRLPTHGPAVSGTHNQQNEVTAVGSTSLAFDANGNLTQDQNGNTLVYDAWNRLVQVKDASNTTLAS